MFLHGKKNPDGDVDGHTTMEEKMMMRMTMIALEAMKVGELRDRAPVSKSNFVLTR